MAGAARPKRAGGGLRLQALPGRYAIIRAPVGADVSWAAGDLVVVTSSTLDAMPTTVICDETVVPPHFEQNAGWQAIRFIGPFDFGEVGVMSPVLSLLAEAQVPVMMVCTYETDYVLIKAARFDRVREELEAAGYEFVGDEEGRP